MRSVIEINFVPNVQSNSDRTNVTLYSAARVQHPHDVLGAQIRNITGERSYRGGAGIEPRIHETTLHRKERVQVAVAESDFRTELAVQEAEPRALNAGQARTVSQIFREGLVEIEAHLAFQHQVMSQAD